MKILNSITRLHEYTCLSAMSLGMQHILLVFHALTLLTAIRSWTRAFTPLSIMALFIKFERGQSMKMIDYLHCANCIAKKT